MASEKFYGRTVHLFDINEGITDVDSAYLIATEDSEQEQEESLEILNTFLKDPNLAQVKALSIGNWSYAYEDNCQYILDRLIEEKDKLQHIEALFIGDMDSEECEISWIVQTNLNPILESFPKLKHFQVRGSQSLSFGEIKHEHLETLILESGGMPENVLEEVAQAHLPQLKHLEIWLGTGDYGFDGGIGDFKNLLKEGLFPKLEFLGLKNCEIADEIAQALTETSLQASIKHLDLSMGIITDEGAKMLLNLPALSQLESLNLRSNYISTDMVKAFEAAWGDKAITIDLRDQKEDDVYHGEVYRYVDVSE